MATSEERLRILRMVEQGQVSAEDGARLLDALNAHAPKRSDSAIPEPSAQARWFRVRVSDLRTGKNKVNVNIPMGLVTVGMKMGARFAPELEGMDLQRVTEMIRSGATGKLIEMEDQEDGERVEIFVE